MKIIYVTTYLPFSSSEAFAIAEIKELLRLGHEVLLVPRQITSEVVHSDAARLLPLTRAEPLFSKAILKGVGAELGRSPGQVGRTLKGTLRGRKLTPLKNASVVPKGLWLAQVARAWGADHIHAYWAATVATTAWIAGEVSGIPWSFTAHRWDITENNLLKEKAASSSFARFISRHGFNEARSLGADVDTKGVVVHIGVELEAEARQVSQPKDTSRPYLICPANLIPLKGHVYLIEAVSRLKAKGIPLRLALAGQGDHRSELEAQVAERGLREEIVFLGQLAHEQLINKYRAGEVDIIVMSSLIEGISVAVIEAMSYGVPAVATSVGGMPELLADGRGLLVPPKDPGALADALERLIRDPKLRASLGQRGQTHVFEEYAVESTTAKMVAQFRAAGRS